MKHEHDDRQEDERYNNRHGNPRNPLSRSQVKLPSPRLAFYWWDNDDFGVGDDAFHVDEVLLRVFGGANEKVLDVIIRATKTEIRVRRKESMIRSLRKLSD